MSAKPASSIAAAVTGELPAPPPLVRALEAATSADGVAALDPDVPAHVWQAALVGPAAELLARPGKDLRARLVEAGCALAGGTPDATTHAIARVLEILHAGSLIVDDVEDQSEVRRGEPALHKLVGEPLAINTGSWMYFWALGELARLALPGATELAVATLVRCHQGQALDLATRVTALDVRQVSAVVRATTRLKTGALCRLAVELGALAAGASPTVRAAIGELGEIAGCALQMLDDLGCLVAPARRDKAYEDLRAARPTWPWAWLAQAHEPFVWARLVAHASAATELPALADALAAQVEPLGRRAIGDTIERALAAVRPHAPVSIVEAIAADLRRMEAMYG
ncbi:MAG TPA: polyprenyl synthetase family protein [Kofleriaceae bacterium]|nr:polyprenyl synthetase family protein [Kofleriaceae bacterium]